MMNRKGLVLFYVLSHVTIIWTKLPKEYYDNRTAHANDCTKEDRFKQVSSDDVVALIYHNATPQFKEWCLAACIGKKMNFMHPNNAFGTQAFLDRLKSDNDTALFEKRMNVINDCSAAYKPDADECKSAELISACLKTKSVGFKFVD